MNRHKDIPLDTALNQCLDYNKTHCSPSKAEYLVRNAVTDVYRRYEPGRAPKSVREEFFLTTSDLTRGERLLLKVAKKSTIMAKKSSSSCMTRPDCPTTVPANTRHAMC